MQEAMQRPEVQAQMAQMQAMMRNEALQARLAELREDPEMKGVFEEIQKGGMGALMKFWNDPKFLSKLGEKLGDVVPPAGAAPPAAAAAAAGAPVTVPQVPDIDNLWDAAKYGDLEAVEDFIAIGKDVSMADEEQRTPLHWAAGMGHADVAAVLLKEGAKLEAADSKGNTPLMYAAGYGRPALVKLLLDAGASAAAKNVNGKTAADLTADPRNPLNQTPELVELLKQGAGAAA
ncbi:Ankyrin repeat domain-containing protein 2 [Monoraphidium neglectum]|uniref:Ankyrin repeat domain-containing protein 2 n=1 Tax=Monoraphidium neglectum TaxID=145388 RepID=A0A0D2MN82_9CHLO|nr:Ankyrin repeat domain-containing protein 2 [Monoraphidium neglectum]KIZ04150.1 Ankyrin repeat domain-containing protein 2 [Monoraphidium neglectum]|eukprot:XP_013903169.1 Ankyrin repeat domain-containing protein 2 [Monoraphidium neglectum]